MGKTGGGVLQVADIRGREGFHPLPLLSQKVFRGEVGHFEHHAQGLLQA